MSYVFREEKWSDCKEICEKLYKGNEYLSPYQSFEFLDQVKLGKKETNLLCTIGYKEKTFVMYKDGEPIVIVPLFENRIKKVLLLRGEFSIMAHLDFVYKSTISDEDYEYLFSQLRNRFPLYTIHLNRIAQKSLTFKYFCNTGKENLFTQSVCVSIPFQNGYEEWYKNLKKSYKQDIRSGYNRIKTDKKEYKFCFDLFTEPEKCDSREMLRLYCKRACEHSKIGEGVKFNIICTVLYYLKIKNSFNYALEHNKNYIGGRIYIDNSLCAYCQCVLSNDGRVIVPKLSIDLQYKRYNLGGLLLNEMIKHISDCVSCASQLDLSRGDERYKYDYGGIEHYNYEKDIVLNSALETVTKS